MSERKKTLSLSLTTFFYFGKTTRLEVGVGSSQKEWEDLAAFSAKEVECSSTGKRKKRSILLQINSVNCKKKLIGKSSHRGFWKIEGKRVIIGVGEERKKER